MKKKMSITLILIYSFVASISLAQNPINDSILKKQNPKEYIRQLEMRIYELESTVNMLSGEVYEDSEIFFEDISEDKISIDQNNRKPSSQQPQGLILNLNSESSIFYFQQENKVIALANGYFDTFIESDNAEIIPDKNNALNYTVIPKQKGICTLNIYGVSESGIKIMLGIYEFNVIDKK